MKRIVLALCVLLVGAQMAVAGNGDKGDSDGIHWLTFQQAEQKMKEQPRKVLIDVYTGWCGWCKVMDKKTYTNPDLIKYVNDNFYAIKFDAEQKSSIEFMGKTWNYDAAHKVNALAIDLLHGRLSYPTTVIMEENFKSEEPIPGYLEVPVMESILKYFGEKAYLHQKWDDYQKSFKGSWSVAVDKK